MAMTAVKHYFPDFEQGKRLRLVDYMYARPVKVPTRKRKALAVDGE
jgi:hypothetical protein